MRMVLPVLVRVLVPGLGQLVVVQLRYSSQPWRNSTLLCRMLRYVGYAWWCASSCY